MSADLENLKHPVMRPLIEAFQKGDIPAWNSFFAPNAVLFDDGNPRDLEKFTKYALTCERFQSIDKIENNGMKITGHFHSDEWGDFVTFFEIKLNDENKIIRLDIGQV